MSLIGRRGTAQCGLRPGYQNVSKVIAFVSAAWGAGIVGSSATQTTIIIIIDSSSSSSSGAADDFEWHDFFFFFFEPHHHHHPQSILHISSSSSIPILLHFLSRRRWTSLHARTTLGRYSSPPIQRRRWSRRALSRPGHTPQCRRCGH